MKRSHESISHDDSAPASSSAAAAPTAATAPHIDALELQYATDEQLLDPTFATAEKRQYQILKLTMMSGRSTVVLAPHFGGMGDVLWFAR
eukprot:1669843-Amphidinium_carterae.1